MAELEARGGGGGSGHIDETFLEARIHDKVREQVELSGAGAGGTG